jgi:hypothetical protein
MYFMKMLFDGYARCLYIYTGVGEEDQYALKSEDFARQLNLRHECRSCDMRVLRKALDQAKQLANSAIADNIGSKPPSSAEGVDFRA